MTSWHVYLLLNDAGTRTYVGATVDPDRRLRQHNREIVGGARATAGDHWRRVCLISGFPDERAALQLEWMWKHLTRKGARGGPMERRRAALAAMLASGRSSSGSTPFAEWPGGMGPQVEYQESNMSALSGTVLQVSIVQDDKTSTTDELPQDSENKMIL
jgi:predicted GIY-YIG superfamily endonuclease